MAISRLKDKTESATGEGRRTREEIEKCYQKIALRFQIGGKQQTSPASLWGVVISARWSCQLGVNLTVAICLIGVVARTDLAVSRAV